MDTTGFFDYPTDSESTGARAPRLPDRPRRGRLGDAARPRETRLFRPGELVLKAGEQDRALYLLVDGLGEGAERRGPPDHDARRGRVPRRAAARRDVEAMSEGEMLRLSFEGFEALAARNPPLGRDILLDLGRILSARLRARRRLDARMDGMSLIPELHADPEPHPGQGLAGRSAPAASSPALVVAALLLAGPDTGLFVMWKVMIPLLPLLFLRRAGRVAQPVPARCVQPDPAGAQAHAALTAPEVAEGVRLRHRVQPVHRLRRPAPLRPRRQRRRSRAAAARRDDRRVHRRHVPQGQERLVLDDLPAAAGAAHLRPDAARLVANAHCQPCVGCVKNCYDFNPRAAYLADLNDADKYWSGYRRYFVGAFPGLVVGVLRRSPTGSDLEIHGRMALYVAASIAVLRDAQRFLKTSPTRSRRSSARSRSRSSTGRSPRASAAPRRSTAACAARAAIALAATWLVRTIRKEQPFLDARAPRRPPPRRSHRRPAGARPRRGIRAAAAPRRSRSCPDNKRVAPKPGTALLEIAEANGMHDRGRLPHGHLRRRPGRDQGRAWSACRRSATTSAPRSTGSASPTTPGWRAACASPGPVERRS